MIDSDLLDETAACNFIGGNRPIHRTTLWRGIKNGRYSKPVRIGAQMVRWIRSELAADIERMAAERDSGAAS